MKWLNPSASHNIYPLTSLEIKLRRQLVLLREEKSSIKSGILPVKIYQENNIFDKDKSVYKKIMITNMGKKFHFPLKILVINN